MKFLSGLGLAGGGGGGGGSIGVYFGGRIGISMEIVEVSEGVASDAGSEAFDREGSKDNSESVEREGSTMGVVLRREIESLKDGSSGEFEEGLCGDEDGETVTTEDSIEDGGKTFREVGESLVGVTFGEAI